MSGKQFLERVAGRVRHSQHVRAALRPLDRPSAVGDDQEALRGLGGVDQVAGDPFIVVALDQDRRELGGRELAKLLEHLRIQLLGLLRLHTGPQVFPHVEYLFLVRVIHNGLSMYRFGCVKSIFGKN